MFLTYSFFSIILLCAYLCVILCYIYYWERLPTWDLPEPLPTPRTSLAVLVAARNEAEGIERCLEALVVQDYPRDLHQIYLIDDHSEDDTAQLVQRYAAQYPHLHLCALPDGQTGKKSALAYGIAQSESDLVVTTDADCIMGPQWLSHIAHFYESEQPKFMAAPAAFHEEQNVFEQFQSLDFMGMILVAGAGIQGQFMGMCNGANLAYERAVFEEVGGFQGIDHLASGDDMLLLQKIQARYPDQIGFLKQKAAQTLTHAKPTVESFVEQRIRWASKSGAYQGWAVQAMLGTVWLLCLSMTLDFLMGFWYPTLFFWGFFKLGVKGLCDYFFLGLAARFFERPKLMQAFLPAAVLHWWYIAFVGTAGLFRKRYQWKGRAVQ